jgi:MSHA biogenesis protein MshQ
MATHFTRWNFARWLTCLAPVLALALSLLPAVPARANTSVLFNGGLVVDCDYEPASATYTCKPFSSSQDVTIASGYTVKVTGAMVFDYNQKLTMSGSASLQVSGKLDIGNIPGFNLNISGGSLVASGPFSMGAQVQTIVADITAAHMDIGTGSDTKVTGTLTANGPINLASHVTLVGDINGGKVTTSSPVMLTGDVNASVSFNLASGSTLNGNLVSPKVELDPSPSRVNGDVTASNKLTIGSASSINGNVIAGKVELQSSEAYITGTALVDRIELNWHGRVYQAITCRDGTPGNPCSCVEDNSGYQNTVYGPVCTPPGANSVHHYQITHDGQGLTCQAETVTVRACANAACTSLYSGAAQVTLSPNTVEAPAPAFNLVNGSASAYVRKTTEGDIALAVTAATPAATTATTCAAPSGASCSMKFADTGFQVYADPRLAGVIDSFRVEALTKNDHSPSSCIPLIANTTKPVVMRCAYKDPASNSNALSRNVNLTNGSGATASLVCGSGDFSSAPGVSLPLAFDANGRAAGTLAYDDVGALALSAEYTASGANFVTADGKSAAFVVAPHHYGIDNASAAGFANPAAASAAGPVFAKASALFAIRVTALSKNNVISTNFGKEAIPGRFRLTHQQVDPLPVNNYKGTLSVPNDTAFGAAINAGASGGSPGRFLIGGLAWNEVGIISLTAFTEQVGMYATFDKDKLERGSQDVLPDYNIGRFIPDHFDTALTTPDAAPIMLCPAGVFPITCTANRFVYAAQPFGLTVNAMSGGAAPTLTRNYAGSYARPITITAWNAAGATGAANGNPEFLPGSGGASSTAIGPSAALPFVFTAGVGQGDIKYAFSASAVSGTQLNKISQPVNVFFRATETNPGGDNVTSRRTAASAEAGVAVVAGRLHVAHSYGSELLRRQVNVESQYWTGSQFLHNKADLTQGATALGGLNVLTFSDCTKNLAAATAGGCYAGLAAADSAARLNFAAGRSSLRVSAPGAGRNGTANLKVEAFPWLPSTTGVLTYGVYRSPVIYLRELH